MGRGVLKRERGDGITHGHAKQPSDVMLQLEVLIGEGLGAVNTGATCTVTIEEISALYHEVFDLGCRISQEIKFNWSLQDERRE